MRWSSSCLALVFISHYLVTGLKLVFREYSIYIYSYLLVDRFECGWQVSGGWLSVLHGPFLFLWVCLCVFLFLFFWVAHWSYSFFIYIERLTSVSLLLVSLDWETSAQIERAASTNEKWAIRVLRRLAFPSREEYQYSPGMRPYPNPMSFLVGQTQPAISDFLEQEAEKNHSRYLWIVLYQISFSHSP